MRNKLENSSKPLHRTPLGELPVTNYLPRPPSPSKAHTSPTKSGLGSLHSSPMRNTSDPMSCSPSRRKNGRVDVFPPSPRPSAEVEVSLERNKNDNSVHMTKPLRPSLSPHLPSISSPMDAPDVHIAAQSECPQSLGRKKERVRADEVARVLLDQGEDDDLGPTVRSGSPSPAKLRTQRKEALHGSTCPPLLSTLSQAPAHVGLDLISHSHPSHEVSWTVLTDACPEEEKQLSNETTYGIEEDKENVRPNPLVLQGRKKGTGGRLSLVATNTVDEGETTVSEA